MLTRILSMDAYIDRMRFIPKEMAKMGLEFERFPAVDPYEGSGPWIGSSYSHTEVLRGVSELLLVCEDDVTFIDGAREIFDKSFAQLPEDWDMLYLGGNVKKPAQRYSENLFRITEGVHCTHAILYSEKGINYTLDNFNALAIDDTCETQFYDHWLFCHALAKMNCYICYPVIAYQRPCYSNARRGYMDYYEEMKQHERENLV